MQILLILSALTFLPLAVFRIWKKQFGFLRVIPGISAIVALLAFLVTFLDWDALFTAFHQLIFRNTTGSSIRLRIRSSIFYRTAISFTVLLEL